MIETHLDEALKEIREALDAEQLAVEVLDRTGRKVVEYDTETVAGMHRGGWQNRTGELESSLHYTVERDGNTITLTEIADAEHAAYLHNREGFTVFTAMATGEVLRLLKEAFEEVRRTL